MPPWHLAQPDLVLADVVGIEKTNEYFRLLYDVRGRFTIHRISPEESKVRLAPVE